MVEPRVTKEVSTISWNYSRPLSGRMDGARKGYVNPSIHPWRPLVPVGNQPRSHSFHTCRPPWNMLYAFFWVIPRCLNFICRRFGTLCFNVVSLFTSVLSDCGFTWTPQLSLWRWCPGIVQTRTDIHIFLFWWIVLWTNRRVSNGLTTFSGNCKFHHGGFWEESSRTSDAQTCMLVQICRWYVRHLAPWPRKTDRISETPQ